MIQMIAAIQCRTGYSVFNTCSRRKMAFFLIRHEASERREIGPLAYGPKATTLRPVLSTWQSRLTYRPSRVRPRRRPTSPISPTSLTFGERAAWRGVVTAPRGKRHSQSLFGKFVYNTVLVVVRAASNRRGTSHGQRDDGQLALPASTYGTVRDRQVLQ